MFTQPLHHVDSMRSVAIQMAHLPLEPAGLVSSLRLFNNITAALRHHSDKKIAFKFEANKAKTQVELNEIKRNYDKA